MTIPAIRAENLRKRYKLGLTHAGSIRELVNRGVRRLAGRNHVPLPHERNGLDASQEQIDDDGFFWALRDVSFEVQPGEGVKGNRRRPLEPVLANMLWENWPQETCALVTWGERVQYTVCNHAAFR
jgi:hypothetical protein